MQCIFSCLIKFHLATGAFCVVIPITRPLHFYYMIVPLLDPLGLHLMLELTARHKNLLPWLSYKTLETFLLVSSSHQNTIVSSVNNLYDQKKKKQRHYPFYCWQMTTTVSFSKDVSQYPQNWNNSIWENAPRSELDKF